MVRFPSSAFILLMRDHRKELRFIIEKVVILSFLLLKIIPIQNNYSSQEYENLE